MGQQLETMLSTCAVSCTSAGIRSAELEFATSTTLYTPLINQNPSSANMLLVKNTHDLAAGVLGPGVSRERLAQEPVVADLLVFELV